MPPPVAMVWPEVFPAELVVCQNDADAPWSAPRMIAIGITVKIRKALVSRLSGRSG
jgi:hypothetical protein